MVLGSPNTDLDRTNVLESGSRATSESNLTLLCDVQGPKYRLCQKLYGNNPCQIVMLAVRKLSAAPPYKLTRILHRRFCPWNTTAFTCLLSRFVQVLTVIWHQDLLSWCHFGTLASVLQTHTLNRRPLKQWGDQREWVYPVREACHWNWIRANWWYYSSGCTAGMV